MTVCVTQKYILPPECNVHAVELYALYQATVLFNSLKLYKRAILTDSLSSFQTLKKILPTNQIAMKIKKQKLFSNGFLFGNEEADKYARETISAEDSIHIFDLSTSEFVARITKKQNSGEINSVKTRLY